LPFTLTNNYGPTEATVCATSGPVPAAGAGRRRGQTPTLGRPIDNVRIFTRRGWRPPACRGSC
jgi:non-ribosomal peptide synthetase component F